jgi:hypothetical protein
MARIRVVKKEGTIIAEKRGHGLFLWRQHPRREFGVQVEAVPPSFETSCARCEEHFLVEGARNPIVAGPINMPCTRKAVRR